MFENKQEASTLKALNNSHLQRGQMHKRIHEDTTGK